MFWIVKRSLFADGDAATNKVVSERQMLEILQEVGLPLVQQPAYAPELNPAERFFEELRRVVEGKVYDTMEAKVAAIEAELREWDADPDRVRRLVGWSWIMDTLGQPLPPETYMA